MQGGRVVKNSRHSLDALNPKSGFLSVLHGPWSTFFFWDNFEELSAGFRRAKNKACCEFTVLEGM